MKSSVFHRNTRSRVVCSKWAFVNLCCQHSQQKSTQKEPSKWDPSFYSSHIPEESRVAKKCAFTSVRLHEGVYTNRNIIRRKLSRTELQVMGLLEFRLITAEGKGYVSTQQVGLSYRDHALRPGVPFPSLASITLSLHYTFFTVARVRGWKTVSCWQVCEEKSKRVGVAAAGGNPNLASFYQLDQSAPASLVTIRVRGCWDKSLKWNC